MESSNKDLFGHYCEITELSVTEQKQYINGLKEHEFELANKLDALVNSNSDLTQVFTDSILDFTDENQLASIGDRLTNYQLTQTLGKGGMGQVFKAERCDGKIEQTVAIKFLHPLFYQYQSGKLLLQEAQALAQLNHPNIATIYDIAETNEGNAYIIMEYIEGLTLDVYLQQNSLSVDNKLSLFNQIADAVLEAHNHQIIHADIKPSNVLITASGQAKLIDFGVMQLTGELTKTAPKLVTHYLCAMTVNYASPEQLNGEKTTISSDIYSLGGLLYFMLSGKSPFEEVGGTLAIKIEHITNELPMLCKVIDKVAFNVDLLAIVDMALSKKAVDRYRTVTHFINDLTNYQETKPIEAKKNNLMEGWKKYLYRNRIIISPIIFTFLILLFSLLIIQEKNNKLSNEVTSNDVMTSELKKLYMKASPSILRSMDLKARKQIYSLPSALGLKANVYRELLLTIASSQEANGDNKDFQETIEALDNSILGEEGTGLGFKWFIQIKLSTAYYLNDRVNDSQELFENTVNTILLSNIDLPSYFINLWENNLAQKIKSPKLNEALIQRYESDNPMNTLSVKEKINLYWAKGSHQLYFLNEFEKAEKNYSKAYLLVKQSYKEADLVLLINIVTDWSTAYFQWKGPTEKRIVELVNEMEQLVDSLPRDSNKFSEFFGALLDRKLILNFYEATKTIEKYDVQNLLEKSQYNVHDSNASIYSAYGNYLFYKGEYRKAKAIFNELLLFFSRSKIPDSQESLVTASRLLETLFKLGDIQQAEKILNEKIKPYLHGLPDLGYYQSEICKGYIKVLALEKAKDFCFLGYNNMLKGEPADSSWVKHSLTGIVYWLSSQDSFVGEEKYIKLQEKFSSNLSKLRGIQASESLFLYYYKRNNFQLARTKLNELSIRIDDFYKRFDSIYGYYVQYYETLLALAVNDVENASNILLSIEERVCQLPLKNQFRLNFIGTALSMNIRVCSEV
jgi:serine/threonine protein kinase